MASPLFTTRELILNSEETNQRYCVLVPLKVYNDCTNDASGVIASNIFMKVEELFVVDGLPKEKTLDYTESMQVLSSLNLLDALAILAYEAKHITIGRKAFVDDTTKKATERLERLSDDDLFNLSKAAPRDMSTQQRVRFVEFLAASMPEKETEDRISPSPSCSQSTCDIDNDSQSDISSVLAPVTPGRVNWTDEATLLLIDRRRALGHLFDSSAICQRQVWQKIAEAVNAKGYNYSHHDCSKKFQNLKQRYKIIAEKNHKTGNSRQYWVYWNAMDEILAGDPAVLPITSISSMKKPIQSTKTYTQTVQTPSIQKPTVQTTAITIPTIQPIQQADQVDVNDFLGSTDENMPSTPRVQRKRRRSSNDEAPLWLERYQEVQQRMHAERMRIEERRVKALESLVTLMQEKMHNSNV